MLHPLTSLAGNRARDIRPAVIKAIGVEKLPASKEALGSFGV